MHTELETERERGRIITKTIGLYVTVVSARAHTQKGRNEWAETPMALEPLSSEEV